MRAAAIVITADSPRWARQAAVTMTGYATSVIGCGCEAAIDRELRPEQTPDGRPGVRVLVFAMSVTELQNQLRNRVGQCVLTSPGSACYGDLEGEERLKLGDSLRYFGDGWQISKRLGAKRYWRIPVMDGEFVCEATVALTRAGRRRRQSADSRREREADARGGGGRGRGDRRRSGRDHAVSRRHRAIGIEDRREIQEHARFNQRRLSARR